MSIHPGRAQMQALVATPGREGGVALSGVAAPSCAHNEALIEVTCFSINRGELGLIERNGPGWIGGWDLAGRVAQAAPDGSGPPVGARVLGYLPRHGGWAELAAVPTTQLAVIPDGVTSPQAIGLAVPGVVALRVIELAGPIAGRELLSTGKFLGGGRILLQLTRLGGAFTTVCMDKLPAKGFDDELREFGADEVVLGAQTLLDQGRTFDPILEADGGAMMRAAIDLLKPNGRIVCFGNASNTDAVIPMDVYNKKQPTLVGFYMPLNTEEHPVAEDLKTLFRLTLAGKISPSIGMEMPWSDAPAAIKRLSSFDWGGKMILHVKP